MEANTMFSLDYSDLDKTVESLFPSGKVPSFSDIVCGLMDGEVSFGELFSFKSAFIKQHNFFKKNHYFK